jgi:tyrosyl-tRNA synthetase
MNLGSSYNITSNKEWFATYKAGDFGAVYQIDGSHRRMMDMEDIEIRTQDGYELELHEVRYVAKSLVILKLSIKLMVRIDA